jgi:hypothetical protein
MSSEQKQGWELLCEKASQEKDSSKLIVLIRELNRALAEKCAPQPRIRPAD